MIDSNGIERLRTLGEQVNNQFYHMVFYQAIDDDLNICYSQIIHKLNSIMLRDDDALHLLKTRDYDLIMKMFEKTTIKMNIKNFFSEGAKDIQLKCLNYKKYNQAYFEEILIDYQVEERVAINYRERFLVTEEEIKLVLEMYAKMDYVDYFLVINLDSIKRSDFINLFIKAIENDAMKVAMNIYLRFLDYSDITRPIMDIIMSMLRRSERFHEYKLFFIHQHFDILSVEQLNEVIDCFNEIINRKDMKKNPALHQFNIIKYSLQIYRISWKIFN